jgi:hypothetical protein
LRLCRRIHLFEMGRGGCHEETSGTAADNGDSGHNRLSDGRDHREVFHRRSGAAARRRVRVPLAGPAAIVEPVIREALPLSRTKIGALA